MYYRFPSVVKSSCMLQTKNFPFDKQLCNMTFSSWAYVLNELNLYPALTTGDTSNYVQNSEWALVSVKAIRNVVKHSSGSSNELIYVISLKRKPFFHILSFIFPCLLISSISLLGFLLPPSSGEKVSIGVTVLLSLSVFLLVVNQTLPANSDEIPYIGRCILGVLPLTIFFFFSLWQVFVLRTVVVRAWWFNSIMRAQFSDKSFQFIHPHILFFVSTITYWSWSVAYKQTKHVRVRQYFTHYTPHTVRIFW